MLVRHRSIIAILALSLPLALVALVSAQSRAERVRFRRGSSSAVLKGRISGFGTRDYLINAKAGQLMTLRLSSSNPYTHFVIYSINERPTDMNETTEWSERLTESGDYLIRVLMVRAGARRRGAISDYTLTVSIQ